MVTYCICRLHQRLEQKTQIRNVAYVLLVSLVPWKMLHKKKGEAHLLCNMDMYTLVIPAVCMWTIFK